MSPPIPLGTEDIPICVPSIRVNTSPTGIHKDIEINSGEAQTDGYYSPDSTLGRTNHASLKGGNIADYPLVCQTFEALGLMVNMGKSQLTPQQELEFLGFLVKLISLHLAFLAKKMRKIQLNTRSLMYQQLVSIRDIARFVGKASASGRATWQAPLHYRDLQYMMNSVSQTV